MPTLPDRRLAACLLSFFLLPAAAAAQGATYVPRELPNLGQLRQDVVAYHDCKGTHGCYKTDLDREAGIAIADLDRAVRHAPKGEKLAVVLDIDETALSNYPEMVKADFGYNPEQWNQWVEQASAEAIPGTLRFCQHAQQLGVAVFFITGRPESQRAATEKNLRAQGYTQWAGLTLRAPDEAHEATIAYKSAGRQKIVAAGYHIAVNMGDQMSDLKGTAQAEYSVKLSDPFYFIP